MAAKSTRSGPTAEGVLVEFLAQYGRRTRDLYQSNLQQLFAWCVSQGVDPLELSEAKLRAYLSYLDEDLGLKTSTIAMKLNNAGLFYRYAANEGYVVDDPAEFIKRPSVSDKPRRPTLSRQELGDCLAVAKSVGRQEYALWCLLSLNGLQPGEALGINVEDLGRRSGRRNVRIVGFGGRGVERIDLDPLAAQAVDALIGTRTEGPLFRMRQGPNLGQRLDRPAAQRIMNKVLRRAGVSRHLTLQSLRYTFMALQLEGGATEDAVRDAMRYTTPKRVRSFTSRSEKTKTRDGSVILSKYLDSR